MLYSIFILMSMLHIRKISLRLLCYDRKYLPISLIW